MQGKTTKSADKNIVDRRRPQSETARIIKDAREMTAGSLRNPLAYERERLHVYAENHLNAKLTIPALFLTVAVVSTIWVPVMFAVYWTVIAGLSYGFAIFISGKCLEENPEDIKLSKWRKLFLISQIYVAISWSTFAFYQCEACGTETTYLIIQFATLLVVQAFTMILCFSFGAGLLITSAPATIILALRLVLSYEPSQMVMGIILLGSQVFFYLAANRYLLSVLSDIAHRAEREQLIAELETAKSYSEEARWRAEEANLAKSRFLATMSHELRTPLNAILGFSEVMNSELFGPIGNDNYREYARDIHDSGSHLLKVINEILDLSRIEAGRQQLQEEAIRLVAVIDDAKHMVQLKAKAKDIGLVTQFEENMPLLWADERAVRQIALNLLSNAIKFTPTGGTVTIQVGWTSAGGQYFSIRDTGPGIPEEEIPIVLSSFGQGSIAIKSAEQGTGLGLPIVQAMMHMHDGRFHLKSELRKGTEAIATFPRSRVMETTEKTENTGHDRQTPTMQRMLGV